jgi:hydrogenase large subunit
MKLSPEVNLLGFAALRPGPRVPAQVGAGRGILGSKSPHIQNLTVGGVSNAINLDSLATLNMDRLVMMKKLMDEVKPFVDQVYLPDVCAIAAMYADWFNYGAAYQLPCLSRSAHSTARTPVRPARRLHHGRQTLRRAPLRRLPRQGLRDGVTEDVAKHAYYKGEASLFIPGRAKPIPSSPAGRPKAEVLLGQGSALPGPSHAGRPAGAESGRLRLGDPLTRKHTDKALA